MSLPSRQGRFAGAREFAGHPDQPHAVGTWIGPIDAVGGQLAASAGEAGDVDRTVFAREELGEEQGALDRPRQHRRGRVALRRGGRRRLEQRLDVDQHRLVTAGDDVLVVDVGGVERVQQRQEDALPPVEAVDVADVRARPVLDEPEPAVARAR